MGRDELLKKIDEFQAQFSLADATIGSNALNDAKFVMRLREGRRCWPETAARVVAYLDSYADEATRIQTTCTHDGTWIALDKRSGVAHSGKNAKVAEANLRQLLEERATV